MTTISSTPGLVGPIWASAIATAPSPTTVSRRDSSASLGNAAAQSTSATLSSLTPSDRTLIAEATGVVISPDGNVVDGGGYADSVGSTSQFIAIIAVARQRGEIQGTMTPQQLASLFPPYVTVGPEAKVSADVVARAMAIVGAPGTTPGQPAATFVAPA